jgi:hypothetical protein
MLEVGHLMRTRFAEMLRRFAMLPFPQTEIGGLARESNL